MIITLSQMAAFFADREGGEIDALKLMKLLYLADRESMRRACYVISNDDMFSLPNGPILRKAAELMQDQADVSEQAVWNRWFSARTPGSSNLKLCTTVSENKLNYFSEMNREILQIVWDKFGQMTGRQLSDYTHDHCNEWKNPPNGAPQIIEEIDVLRAVGTDEKYAHNIAEDIKHGKALCRAYAETPV
jgi:uncharacterized phage-associated protein